MLFILAMQQYQNISDNANKSVENDQAKAALLKEAMRTQSKILQQQLKQKIREIQQQLYMDRDADDFGFEENENNNNEEFFEERNEDNLESLENNENINHHHKKKIKKNKTVYNLIEEKKVKGNLIDKLQNSKCSICLDDFNKGKHISYLPCCHVYHSKCIKKWLKVSNLCPLCKEEVKI